MIREINLDDFFEYTHLSPNLNTLIETLIADRDEWRTRSMELEGLVIRQTTLINRLRSERDNAQQERNNLQLENPILRGQVERQRLTIEELTDENQKLRDAAVQAPFAKYEVYEDD